VSTRTNGYESAEWSRGGSLGRRSAEEIREAQDRERAKDAAEAARAAR
jgi:hypothetical protein